MVGMSCLALIQSARDEMSANEKKLADFIVDNAPLIRDYSSQQIASSVGVSQSSVVKFSQKMGYKGFTDLKLAIHESVVKQESKVSFLRGIGKSRSAMLSLKDRLFQAKTDAISGATDLNNDATLNAAVRAIESASRIQLVGTGHASAVVREMAYKLMRLGKPVIAEGDAEVQFSGVASLVPGDCFIVLSADGRSKHLLQLTHQAKKAGVTVISLTNQSANPISVLADIKLYSLSQNRDADMVEIIAATSQQHVMDLVYHDLTQPRQRGGTNRARTRKSGNSK
jgi:RpiR family murPQ operon transcriptional repressor